MIQTVAELAASQGVAVACAALAVPRSSFYRAQATPQAPATPEREPAPRPAPPRALSAAEKAQVREELNSERFQDQAPREVYATLLDEERYLCSVSTMYRILAEHAEVRERRNQLRHPAYQKPELLATEPGLELGYHQTTRAEQGCLLLSVCDDRHLQPLCGGLAAGRSRVR